MCPAKLLVRQYARTQLEMTKFLHQLQALVLPLRFVESIVVEQRILKFRIAKQAYVSARTQFIESIRGQCRGIGICGLMDRYCESYRGPRRQLRVFSNVHQQAGEEKAKFRQCHGEFKVLKVALEIINETVDILMLQLAFVPGLPLAIDLERHQDADSKDEQLEERLAPVLRPQVCDNPSKHAATPKFGTPVGPVASGRG